VAVSRDVSNSNRVNGYRVHYKRWSTRFDEWVSPERVVEPSQHNLDVQEELLEECGSALREGVPAPLQSLMASKYIGARRRAKGATFLRAVSLQQALRVNPGASSSDQMVAILKASLLVIEAALPLGSVDNTTDGPWNTQASSYWRFLVEHSPGLSTLMGCVILLQDAVSKAWFRQRGTHMMECLPMCYRAMEDATLSSIATRIYILDRSLLYGLVSHADPASHRSRSGAATPKGRRSGKTGRFVSRKEE
jgi:hypothetical protein